MDKTMLPMLLNNALFSTGITLHVLLPVGISTYITFQ
jgi:hypothetical protein